MKVPCIKSDDQMCSRQLRITIVRTAISKRRGTVATVQKITSGSAGTGNTIKPLRRFIHSVIFDLM